MAIDEFSATVPMFAQKCPKSPICVASKSFIKRKEDSLVFVVHQLENLLCARRCSQVAGLAQEIRAHQLLSMLLCQA